MYKRVMIAEISMTTMIIVIIEKYMLCLGRYLMCLGWLKERRVGPRMMCRQRL